MELTYRCPGCQQVNRIVDPSPDRPLVCDGCGQTHSSAPQAIRNGALQCCPFCGTEDLYIQKDFPHRLGLAILVAGFAVSTAFWYAMMPLATFGVLLATVFLDWILYHRVPDVTICYRCLSQVRGPGSNPERRFQPFDLAIGERYRQERLRLEQLRSEQRG
ncbi:MAG: hypothetical protein KatS3mg108_1431 [Isosphaeraceae bacterium]|jgi:hypothetical protein|nr:MAG: hypothetical protein KatS3mg108_1431 [Isosphaeraceae bacterium]